jgi:hypothetical protein
MLSGQLVFQVAQRDRHLRVLQVARALLPERLVARPATPTMMHSLGSDPNQLGEEQF